MTAFPPARILCVDDDESILFVLEKLLVLSGYEVAIASHGGAAMEEIARRAPDLVILDLQMSGMSGLEICRALKSNVFTARIPILMLTAQSDIEAKIVGFEAGADEYLAKPFYARELTARIAALLRLVQREGERNPSSGLPGGRAIESAIARRAAIGDDFAIIYFDLDHFKPFADTFGFARADAAIIAVGAAIADAVRAPHKSENQNADADFQALPDFAGHIGGDDFLVVTSIERAELIARVVAEDFALAVRALVDEQSAARGVFEAIDRDGQSREFVLAGISAAIVAVAAGSESLHHLGAVAAQVKREAKAQGAGTILVRSARV